jgi:hypothetical protein
MLSILKFRYVIFINPATKLVIPAATERRTGIQKRLCNYRIPVFSDTHLRTFPPSYLPSLPLVGFIAVYHDLAPRLPPISNPINARVKKNRIICESLVNGIRINKISAVNKCNIISNSYGPN